ncbi:tRNA (mo5U34)-methyltransferase [Striga asiatica]|uniref:tRNA (Mo5U34)-methyltransferase n=1 Tax=Striga asiatica TaxID=4170 RepID=A0A5A7PLA2_STRAF|nr:tRNA (mo5U34)-methyltransferase [Striga asiatica]
MPPRQPPLCHLTENLCQFLALVNGRQSLVPHRRLNSVSARFSSLESESLVSRFSCWRTPVTKDPPTTPDTMAEQGGVSAGLARRGYWRRWPTGQAAIFNGWIIAAAAGLRQNFAVEEELRGGEFNGGGSELTISGSDAADDGGVAVDVREAQCRQERGDCATLKIRRK